MANYNRTRLRSIDNTVANSYLTADGTPESTGSLARTFSFRGRNCLSPIGDLENNNLVLLDSVEPAIGWTGGSTGQSLQFVKDLINLDGSMLSITLIKIFIAGTTKYVTAVTNGGFGDPVTFNAPAYGTIGTYSIVVCTPFGYYNNTFSYSNIQP